MATALTSTMQYNELETITTELAEVVGGRSARPAAPNDDMMLRTDAAKMLTACGTNGYAAARADLLAEQNGTRQVMGPHETRGRALDVCDQGVAKLNARKR